MLRFKSIKWKNLLSTGNSYTTIDFLRSPSTLITGENGAGKSTMLDALCFVLYGKPFRRIKKDQLVNSINARDCVVEIEFETNGKSYRIVRGIKPNVFEIYSDGSLLNQSAAARDYQEILEKNILRMNMKSFTQIVILGSSSFVPFMQLTTNARREVLEDLLDIRIFSRMSSVLKERQSTLKETTIVNEKDLEAAQKLLQVHEKARTLAKETRENTVALNLKNIENLTREIQEHEVSLAAFLQRKEELRAQIVDLIDVRKKKSELTQLRSSVATKIKNATRTIEFYENHNHCPTCDQSIEEALKTSKIQQKTSSVEKYEDGIRKMDSQLSSLSLRLEEIDRIEKEIDRITLSTVQIETHIESNKASIRRYQAAIDKINETEPFDETQIDKTKEKIATLELERQKLLNQRELFDSASIILKDTGIKSKVVKQYIPVINNLVNKYLAAMEFFVKFELNENFEEKILSRHRDDFTYDSFSEGEKMRIDLALLFTWRAIARMKNSANTNLLILDEVFDASLDASGCDEFLEILESAENTNVFCISHKGDVLQDKFRSAIRFTKQGNFSRMAQP